MSKVFIINNMTHNYSKAEKFGELVDITNGKMPIFKTDVMSGILKDGLEDFSNDDYLLISGPALLCIMAAQAAFVKFDEVKFLIFDAKIQDYVVRHLHRG